ncbi:MAG: family 78 glycoside hydrolase catalytic domain, partial [Gorillibacterium sp.]|nr:family 78 glycoside hydrolase catalytic domain [Gorillibacterium sp.]
PRMCCQQAFAETIDARLQQGDWTSTAFDDASWEPSVLIPPTEAPWKSLVERDIPFLTEEKFYPSAMLSLYRVRPPVFTAALDLRNQMVPESANHANPIEFCGYLATKLVIKESGCVTVGFPNGTRTDSFFVNGVNQVHWEGEQPERYYRLHLEAGEHLLLLDVTSWDHGGSFHMAADSDIPFTFLSPLAGVNTVPFVTIGPFDHTELFDHQENRVLRRDHPVYLALKNIRSTEELLQIEPWIRPIDQKLYTEDDVFGSNVWRPLVERRAVPLSLQNAILPTPEPAVLPLFEHGDCELVIDLGKERSGFLGFEIDAPEGTIVDAYGVEYIHEQYIQHTYGLDNTFRYLCKAGRQRYVSPVRRGLRYLILTVRANKTPVKLYEVFMNQSTYPAAEVGRFACSDPLLNEVWEISRHTTRLCMEDTFVDCPTYEQVFWVGDSRNEALINYYVFGATDIVKRCLSLVPKSADMTPLYVDQVPSAWSSVIPNWTFFWITACGEYVAHTGDTHFAKEIWPAVRYTLTHYLKHLDDSMLLNIKGWNLLDWAPIDQPNDGIVTHQNLFMAKALRSAISLAETAGAAAEGVDTNFANIADQMVDAINEHLWSEERNAYLDCIHTDGTASEIFSMQTQVVAYLCEAVNGVRKSTIEGYLCSPPPEFVQIGSPFMSFFYYEALEKANKYALMLEDIRKNYGLMVKYDATTCWEAYPNFTENRANPKQLTRSHCHAWSAAPGYFLGSSILGIKRLDTGWNSVVIAPQPCDLAWANGIVPLPQGGHIAVSWSLQNKFMTLRVDSPEDVNIHIQWPEGIEGRVEQLTYIR